MGQGVAKAGQPQVRPPLLFLIRPAADSFTHSIVIALAGNKVDLVRPSSDGDDSASDAAVNPEDSEEADDATATPEDEAGSAAGDDEGPDGGKPSESRRQVSREEAEEYAKECGLLFFETSAKTGEGVVEVFTEIGECACTPIGAPS